MNVDDELSKAEYYYAYYVRKVIGNTRPHNEPLGTASWNVSNILYEEEICLSGKHSWKKQSIIWSRF